MGSSNIAVVTGSGLVVTLRRGRSDDGPALLAAFEHLSEQSRLQRFFTAMPRLNDQLLANLVELDDHDRTAIVAFDPAKPSEVGTDEGLGVGVARYLTSKSDQHSAELAVTVIDEYQHQGVGRVLLEALVIAGLHAGMTSLYGYVLRDNAGMIRLFRRLGGREQHTDRPEPGVQRMAIDLEAAATTLGPRRETYAALFR